MALGSFSLNTVQFIYGCELRLLNRFIWVSHDSDVDRNFFARFNDLGATGKFKHNVNVSVVA